VGRPERSVSARWRLALRYLLLLAWMFVIFRASATPDLKAVPWAQRFHMLPDVLGVEATNLLEFVLRKGAHMLSFGVLALLARLAFAGTWPALPRLRLTAVAWAFALLYAISDELHQTFVPTRVGSPSDIGFDAAGAALALLLAYRRSPYR
jgi:VanZ family protein